MTEPARQLLDWYDTHARDLPWRVPPCRASQVAARGTGKEKAKEKAKEKERDRAADPYRVWLSEIMLQQTTVAAVIPYFEVFTARWPTVEALAATPLEEVLAAWAGLGYYARARNLHACARRVAFDFGGDFPDTEDGLRALPGVGVYTAAAIASIAFGRRAVVVDGNVERVMARFHAVETPLPDAKADLRALAETMTPERRAGDYAQAVMDLGATICTPRSPDCPVCPLAGACRARAQGDPARLPVKRPKADKPLRQGAVFWLTRADGAVLVHQRPGKGLLAGMTVFPAAGFWTALDAPPDPDRDAPARGPWTRVPGLVRHTFTHFHLELTVWTAGLGRARARETGGRWIAPDDLDTAGLPTVMRKVADHVRGGAGPLFQTGSKVQGTEK
ncbi:MAG: A/G-specific adenine glycosylase [Alphaproteobacteria bacterium]